MAERKRRGEKLVTDLTDKGDVTPDDIIRGLMPEKERPRDTSSGKSKWDKLAE